MNRRSVISAALALAAAACSNETALCTSANCANEIAFSPPAVAISATLNQASAPFSATISGQGDSAWSVSCDHGLTATPASGALADGKATISITAPGQSTVGTVTAICTVSSGPTTGGTLTVSIMVSAPYPTMNGNGTDPIGNNGGAVDHLYFAVVGDSRPANIDDTPNYPTAVIEQIYRDVQALSPRPQFAVATGDYVYSNTTANTAQPQASLYMQARGAWTGTFFPVMGNHECDGFTADNCTVNQTQNNQAFMQTILVGSGRTLPYYSIPIHATDNSWTAKLLFVACNAWDQTQESWLTTQLETSTTYTILIRHEPAEANTAPCVTPVETIMASHPYDLSLVGHTHEFSGRSSSREVVIGNGGAPLSRGTYGYATVERVSNGWAIANYDYSTGLAVNSFTISDSARSRH